MAAVWAAGPEPMIQTFVDSFSTLMSALATLSILLYAPVIAESNNTAYVVPRSRASKFS